MTESSTANRPVEVTVSAILLFGNGFLGVIVAVFGLIWWEDALSAIGFIVAAIGIWVGLRILARDKSAWTLAILLNVIGIPLYFVSFAAFEGIFLCVFSLIYLNIPNVKQHLT